MYRSNECCFILIVSNQLLMHIFFSVGEPSGDQHAAQLIAELKRRRPETTVSGYGGPLMEEAGCRLHFRLTELAVMGFFRVVPLLWKFYRLVKRAERFFRESRPDAVVLIDFPGFNWWIARRAKAAGIPVFYYVPPQLWAWASWRVDRIRRFVDHVLCTLPFEPKWYAERGVDTEYVGHPFFDEVAQHELNQAFLETWASPSLRNVAVLPGSRNHEISQNWPLMLKILRRVHTQHANVRFLVACYSASHQQACARHVAADADDLPIHIFVGKTPEVIELAECALMVSGSVSLEMLARTTPCIVLYHVAWPTYFLCRALVECHYISLPNMMAEYELVPEYPCAGRAAAEIGRMSDRLNHWLERRGVLDRVTAEMIALRDSVAQTGATARAAESILCHLESHTAARAA